MLNTINDPPSPQRVSKRKEITKKINQVKENQEEETNILMTTSLNPREVISLFFVFFIN